MTPIASEHRRASDIERCDICQTPMSGLVKWEAYEPPNRLMIAWAYAVIAKAFCKDGTVKAESLTGLRAHRHEAGLLEAMAEQILENPDYERIEWVPVAEWNTTDWKAML